MTPAFRTSCLDALSESTSEVAATVLGGMPFTASPEASDLGAALGQGQGAYLGLVAREEPIQVGLVADAAGCQLLAKALLGMDAADEDLPVADVSDAMCEIINIVAGGLKRRVIDRMPVTLGLPIFVAGPPLPNPQQEMLVRALSIGAVPASLLLVTQRAHVVPISQRDVSRQAARAAEESA